MYSLVGVAVESGPVTKIVNGVVVRLRPSVVVMVTEKVWEPGVTALGLKLQPTLGHPGCWPAVQTSGRLLP